MEIPDILHSVDPKILETEFSSVSDRYYEHKFCAKLPTDETKAVYQRVSFHSNRICLISLAPDHPVIKDNKRVLRVNYTINDKVDRTKNAASGKGKRGAQKLSPDSVLCYVECEDEVFPVYSCIKGKLVEINENLVDEPRLLIDKPKAEGYIALLLPILNTYEDVKDSMLSESQYLSCR